MQNRPLLRRTMHCHVGKICPKKKKTPLNAALAMKKKKINILGVQITGYQ